MDKISPEQAAEKMKQIFESDDLECAHYNGDDLLTQILRENGFSEAAEIFDNASKWYA